MHLYTLASFRRLIHEAGFRITSEDYTVLPFELVVDSTGRSFTVACIDWLYDKLVRLWPALFAYQVVLEAELTALDTRAGEGRATEG